MSPAEPAPPEAPWPAPDLAAPPSPPVGPSPRRWWSGRPWPSRRPSRGTVLDVALAGLLGALTFAVHDLHYAFTTPYWADESWVAVSTRLPLGRLREVTASSPIGWTFLLRLVVWGGDQRQRVVPLLFAALTVAVAYAFARRLPWTGRWMPRIAGCLAAVAVLLVPSSLVRNDLKQYTAEAFSALVVWLLVARLDARWDRRRLAALAAASVGLFLIGDAAVILAPAAFAAVSLGHVARRRWRPLAETAVAGAAAGAGLGVVYVAFYAHGNVPGLQDFWRKYYVPLPDGVGATADWFHLVARPWFGLLNLGPLWLAVLLVALGVGVLVAQRLAATALFLPAVLAWFVALSAARRYPLFDLRTSHFLAVLCVVAAAVGVAGVCQLVASRLHVVASVAVALAAVVAFRAATPPHVVAAHSHAYEDLRTATRYLQAHARPGDVVVVNHLGSWALAYYSSGRPIRIERTAGNLQQFLTVPQGEPPVFVADTATEAGMRQALDAAALARGTHGRIWFLHLHTRYPEINAALTWATGHGFTAGPADVPGIRLLSPAAVEGGH